MRSYYELLGASADDDAEALKKAFRKAVKVHHPDLRPNDPDALERFREIIAANVTLRDAKRRATYDWFLRLERESFQLMLKRQRLPLKRMRTIAVIAAVGTLIGGYGLWTTVPTSGKLEIDKDEFAAVAGAVQKQTATVVAAVKENANPSAAIGATEADAVKGDNADEPGEPVGGVRIQPADPAIVAAHIGTGSVGNGRYEARNDGANMSTAATDIAPALANAGLASDLGTMVATPGTNYDRTRPIADAGTVIKLPLVPAVSVPAMKPQSVLTPAAPAVTRLPASFPRVTAPSRDTFPARAASRQLTIDAIRLRQTDALLTISAGDVGSDAAVVVGGLAPGSTLSAGTAAGPNGWRLSADDLGDVVVAPPRGFVGAMDLSLELRLPPDQTAVDRKALRLEWSANNTLAPPKSQRFKAAEIALMMEKGAALIGMGNVGGARMVLQNAAEAGDPAAAFALAETYDPLVLRRLDVKGGIVPDIALANVWYEKAKDLGSIVASERLKSLAALAK